MGARHLVQQGTDAEIFRRSCPLVIMGMMFVRCNFIRMLSTPLTTQAVICGGGPAGMMLGFLLARAGVDVVLMEKHKDFFRDFRGDTIHPSTFQLMHELGLLDEFLKLPHQEATDLHADMNGVDIHLADFSHLPVARKAVGIMPQWDFLNFIARQAARYPGFHLLMETKVTGLVKEEGRVRGVEADGPGGTLRIHGDIVVGTDGRSSDVRRLSGLHVTDTGAPIDVLWFRLSRKETDPGQVLGRFENGRIMVLLGRGDYWQCAYVIEKGGYDVLRKRGIEEFRKEIAETTPFLKDRVAELVSWDEIRLLSVVIDHLDVWYCDGLICIGDAAHAMSPIGGVGINLALQDAVATANILYPVLAKKEPVTTDILKRIQKRREFPARMVQRLQVFIQKGIHARRSNEKLGKQVPFAFHLFRWVPWLRRIPARLVGLGIRPEHIGTPEMVLTGR